MPFVVPTSSELRRLGRDNLSARIAGAEASTPNSVLRVLSDSNAGLAGLTLQFIYWLSQQLLPDTAEEAWLLRHVRIHLGGPKEATFAEGTVTFSGIEGSIVPALTQLVDDRGLRYETLAPVALGSLPAEAAVRALDAGALSNRDAGATLSLATAIGGVNGVAVVGEITGGINAEGAEEMRTRLLEHIRNPPMGGAAHDFVEWAMQYPGVTRAWNAPHEMGVGTTTVRFMMDEARANEGGFPNAGDIAGMKTYLEGLRPVTGKDLFVVAPVAEPIDFTLSNLESDNSATLNNIEVTVRAMLRERARPAFSLNGVSQPAQTIYREWVSRAVSEAAGVDHFELTMTDHEMPTPGHLAVLGNIIRD